MSKKPSRMSQLMGLTEDIRGSEKPEPAIREPRTAPGQLMATLTGRDEAEKRAEQAETALAELKASHRASLWDLHEKPGRRRFKSAEEKAELEANMRREGMISAIVVERREEGGYWIIAGHHRVDNAQKFYDEGLEGWDGTVAIEVIEGSGADRKAFYSNLFHPSLPDFEKFEGLKKIAKEHALTTRKEISEFTGMALGTVNKLYSFDGLPENTLQLLSVRKNLIGANTAEKLSALAKDGKQDGVVASVIALAEDGQMTQDQAVQLAKNYEKPKAAEKPKKQSKVIKMGTKTYCTVTPAGNHLRLAFADEKLREAAEPIIADALAKIAALEKKSP